MKATIQQIVEHISALSEPLDPGLVQKIFINYPEFTSSALPKGLEYIWTQLDLILKLAQQGVELKEIIKDLKSHEADILLYSEKGIVAQKELAALEVELTRLKNEIAECRSELTSLYTTLLETLKIKPPESSTQELPPDLITKRQLEHIVAIRKDIQGYIKVITLPTAKLKLLELNEKQTELLNAISHYSERNKFERRLPSIDNEEGWKAFQFSIAEKLNKIIELKPQLEKLQEGFAECLSTSDSQTKIASLQAINTKLTIELEDLAKKIQKHPLKKDLQLDLTIEFQQTPHVPALIESYKRKVDSILSYVDLGSWASWLANKSKYNEEQALHVQRLGFLTLLNLQKEKQLQQTNLLAQIEILTKISNSNVMSSATEERLVSQATTLLNQLPGCKVPEDFNPKADVTDFYLLLINNIFLIPDNIKKYEALLALINKLLPIMSELLGYRRDYNLPAEQDSLLPSIEELQQALPEEANLAHKNEQLETCELYFGKAKLLVAKLQLQRDKVQAINTMQREVEFNIEQLKIALEFKAKLQQEKTFAAQIEEFSGKLATCQSDMAGIKKKIIETDVMQDKTLTEHQAVVAINNSEPPVIIDELPTFLDVDLIHQPPIHYPPKNLADPVVLPPVHLIDAEPLKVIKQATALERPSDDLIGMDEPNISPTSLVSGKKEHDAPIIDSQPITKPTLSHLTEPPQVSVSPKQTAVIIDKEGNQLLSADPVVDHNLVPAKLIPRDGIDVVSPDVVSPDIAAIEIIPVHPPIKHQTLKSPPDEHSGTTTSVSVKATHPNAEEALQVNLWHRANLAALANYPETLQNWYHELYAVTEEALKKTPYSQKYSHLIRDILFELQNKQELFIIETYRQTCPSPKEDCEALLALKPDYKIVECFAEKLEEESLPVPLKKLHSQYKNLKIRHPIAAELLLQTIQSLYWTWKGMGTSAATSLMSSIIDDPRYEVLKRHRGFFKVVEAIEDFFRWISGKISGQPEYEYRKKPSFFKTHTEELIEEAELFITPIKQP
ncbi:hypothetical protein [Legionella sp. km772]|uniref:hypothetical protein n=1 Tax=Legionella sp. km772 TaxID=2498111 RepID=UPI000F8EEC55|nr:hypothetical protein [Legionella sp. km772]RUR13973.1 hypothetical protein ELY15_00930 [Legionella sp. km772]